MSPVNEHDPVTAVVHVADGVGIVVAIVGVGAVVSRWDVISTVVAVVVRVVVVRAAGRRRVRHGSICCCYGYVNCLVMVLVRENWSFNVVVMRIWSGTNLRPSEALLAFLFSPCATSRPRAADAS